MLGREESPAGPLVVSGLLCCCCLSWGYARWGMVTPLALSWPAKGGISAGFPSLALSHSDIVRGQLLAPRSAPRAAPPPLMQRVLSGPGALLPVPCNAMRLLLFEEVEVGGGRGGRGGACAVHLGVGPIRLVSCYTLLSRCRLPWPLPSCRDGARPLRCSLGTSAALSWPVLLTRVAH